MRERGKEEQSDREIKRERERQREIKYIIDEETLKKKNFVFYSK